MMVPDDTAVKRTDGSDTDSDAVALLPLISDQGNRRILTDWIRAHEQYDLVDETNAVLTADFDCLIVDRRSLVEWAAEIRERKEADELLVPVVLLVEESEEKHVRAELRNQRRGLWERIDAVVTMPITERRLADQLALLVQLREQSREIAAQRGELGILNRVLRHDIRNDLNVILGWADLLQDHVDEEGDEYVDRILHSGNHIVELTQVASDIAEDLAAGEKSDLEPVDLNHVLEEEVQNRKEMFDAATIEIRDPPEPDTVVWANEMLSSVFRNIINNAVQHNDSDTPTVAVTADQRNGSVVVRIADDGPGISEELKGRIFDESQKGIDSAGTGLGLYLVQSLVEAYGGSVWIEDNDPQGTIFAVELIPTESHPKENS